MPLPGPLSHPPAVVSAIVTGGASGIGRACAAALARAGAHVVTVDVRPQRDALPGATTHLQASVADPHAARDAVAAALEATGTLDALVNAAGIALMGRDGSIADLDLSAWRETAAVNLDGAMLFAREALRVMRDRRSGALVHVASVAGLRGMDDPLDAYQVSKAGLVSLSRAIAVQYGPLGIRSNTICPGAILTPLIAPLYEEDPARRVGMEQRTPLRRLGTTEDVAATCLYLLSPAAGFVTGIDLVVDGGWSAVLP